MATRDANEKVFVVSGAIHELETDRPLAGLIVRAYDRDWISDDKLGYTSTDDDGQFEIRFTAERFRDLVEARPDLYLRVYDPSGVDLLHETSDAIRWNASQAEHYRVLIPARAFDPTKKPNRGGAA